MISQTIQITTF